VTTWYSLQRWSSGVAPAPMNWLAYQGIEVPVYWSAAWGADVVWLDDTAISYPELYANDTVLGSATRSAIDLPDAGDGGTGQGLQRNAPSPLGLTGGLLLECLSQDSANFWLRLHGTVGGDNYQLLSTSNEEIWLVIPDERRK
jgi:hypothetical protein